ncbi:MAG: hypothetical protein ACRCW2_02370 [Cellulosilyticaceae bacterium]
MKRLVLLGIIFGLSLQVGCSMKEAPTIEVTAPASQTKHTNVELYIENTVAQGPYEPDEGIYLGAYAQENAEIFKQGQVFKVFQFTKTHPVTDQDLLRCIAEQKVPYIKVLMTDEYDMTAIYQLVGSLRSKYKTPLFIELYPVSQEVKDATQYKVYYEQAYEIVKKYLPESVIVWSIDFERAHESVLYYPGDHLVDWVGLNMYMPRFKDGQLYEPDVTTKLDMWYKSYQKHKPMLISSLGISHFSKLDHTYTVEYTKDKLDFFYTKLPELYPRIKGIIYADVDLSQVYKDGTEDYRISSQLQLSEHMTKLWQSPNFKHTLMKSAGNEGKTYMKYTVPVLEYEERVYVDYEYIKEIVNLKDFENEAFIQDEKGKAYYDLAQLKKEHAIYSQP